MASEDFGSLESLQVLLQQNPNSLTFGRVADALLKLGRVDEAIQLCEDGLRRHPSYVTGHMVLGKCYLKKKLFDQAEKEFKRVLLFDSRYLAAHKYYGDLMREIGWDNTCEMSYRKILQIDPLDKGVRAVIEELAQKVKMEKMEPAPIRRETRPAFEPPASPPTPLPPIAPVLTPMPADDFYSTSGVDENDLLRYQPAAAADDGMLEADFAPPAEAAPPAAPDLMMPPANDEERFSYILDDIFQDEILDEKPETTVPVNKNATPASNNRRDEAEKLRADETNRGFGENSDGVTQPLRAASRIPTRPVDFDLEGDGDATTITAARQSSGRNFGDGAHEENNAAARPNARATGSTRLPARRPKILEDHGDDLAATVTASEREKIVTPTLGEIYAAQGQYTKAIGVFELLSRKEPNNKHYRDKIDYLKKRLQETQNAG
jgi:tetratricopeptide (TPR) repeat protein